MKNAIEFDGQVLEVEDKTGKKSEIQIVYQFPAREVGRGNSKQPVPVKQITNKTKHLHSETEPAVVYDDGTKEWFKNGLRHRNDGPARIFPDGYIEWWLDGQIIFFEDWAKKVGMTPEEETAIKLKYFDSMKNSIFSKNLKYYKEIQNSLKKKKLKMNEDK